MENGVIYKITNPTGKIVKEWEPSFSEISKILNCDASTIRKAVISNGNKMALNHKWKYTKNERI